MPEPATIPDLLKAGAGAEPAIAAPGRPALGHGPLRALVAETVAALNGLGVGRGDRVAMVLPNGPEMATAFLAIAAGAACAPLNPAYRRAEFEFYLGDLGARALVVEPGSASPALDVAHALGVPVLELAWHAAGPAGGFTLSGSGERSTARPGPAEAGDEALVLHTSGTTSRPKMVPLSHANLVASAGHVAASLDLGPADRCLNVMPLFHIHGLVAALLASLAAGGSVFCAPGFNALKFFAWMAEAGPTWYTAVPTMHQAILARAGRNVEAVAANPLRFLRSSSAALPPRVMAELEAVFGAPVIEAYGMTEAAHQMTANPLPPRPRKAGTVGPAAGPEVSVMDPAGALLGPGESGEIVIRGPNVSAGYDNNEEANAAAFTDGWFRTGDQGVVDGDGYITITGRLKEIINRGGEKISPREVDEVLLDHPAVVQAVTFAVPHGKLGEDVAAAVVLRDGSGAGPGEKEIREFAARVLAPFKVPRRIVIVDEIPMGATGKLQRMGLAQKLGLAGGEGA